MPTNVERARWGEAAVRAMCRATEGDDDYYDSLVIVLVDVLANLMHFARQEDVDFAACLAQARTHYATEVQEGQDDTEEEEE